MARRYSRAFSIRPVRSVKEYIESVNLGVAGATTTTIALVSSVNNYTGTAGTCPIGATVKYIELQIYIQRTLAVDASMDYYIAKQPAGTLALPVPGSLGGSAVRRFIFHAGKGLTTREDDGAMVRIVRLRIPPRFRRFGENDILQLQVRSATDYNVCVLATYKWFS